MNKFSFALFVIILLTFANHFKVHFSVHQKAEEKVQHLIEENQKNLDALNAKDHLSEHEQWLQQHLSKSLSKTRSVQQGAQLTKYSMISMFAILLLSALAFIWVQRRPSPPAVIDISTTPPHDHPIAQQLSWQALGSLSANFTPQRLKQEDPYTWRISSSAEWLIFAAAFALLGLNALCFSLYKIYISSIVSMPILGITFMTVGIGLWAYGLSKSWVIDTQAGTATSPSEGLHDIADIIALQYITGLAGGRHRIFNVYEVNLILKDAQRSYLIRHSNPHAAMADATRLARALGVPLWRQ